MRYALALLATTLSGPVSAQGIPAHDVDAACGRLPSKQGAAFCVRQEQEAYDAAQMVWPLLSERGRERVLADAKGYKSTASYYEAIASFAQGRLAIEQQQRDAVSTPRFKP